MSEDTQVARPQFPCAAMPEEPPRARLLGLYAQRQEGLYLQRVKILGGRLEHAQWKAVAELAFRFTPGWPLRLTVRQGIEFHGLQSEAIPALQRGLAEAGLTSLGAAGDTVRNVTVCPECGLVPGSCDMIPLGRLIHDWTQARPDIYSLPRKFKISLSGCPHGCAYPFINDIGFVARADGSLQAILAGSLGAHPGAGIEGYDNLPVNHVLPLVSAALRLFEDEGDRTNRSRARLRHVRERLGDAVFLKRLDNLFEEEKGREFPQAQPFAPYAGPQPIITRLTLPHDELEPERMLELAGLAENKSAPMHIGVDHRLYLFGVETRELPTWARVWTNAPRTIACPGAHLCQRGIAPTWEASDAIRAVVPASLGLVIGISGCPNNCAQASVADIGLIGRLKSVGGEKRPHYRFLAGGGRGASARLARELHTEVPLEQIGPVTHWLVEQWLAARLEGTLSFEEFVAQEHERLATTMARRLEVQV